MAKAKVVDPDYFNPFSPIPFHNNPELKYVFADVNMRNYLNRANGIPMTSDYTPAWARGNNNHAWNVLLDADGIGRIEELIAEMGGNGTDSSPQAPKPSGPGGGS